MGLRHISTFLSASLLVSISIAGFTDCTPSMSVCRNYRNECENTKPLISASILSDNSISTENKAALIASIQQSNCKCE